MKFSPMTDPLDLPRRWALKRLIATGILGVVPLALIVSPSLAATGSNASGRPLPTKKTPPFTVPFPDPSGPQTDVELNLSAYSRFVAVTAYIYGCGGGGGGGFGGGQAGGGGGGGGGCLGTAVSLYLRVRDGRQFYRYRAVAGLGGKGATSQSGNRGADGGAGHNTRLLVLRPGTTTWEVILSFKGADGGKGGKPSPEQSAADGGAGALNGGQGGTGGNSLAAGSTPGTPGLPGKAAFGVAVGGVAVGGVAVGSMFGLNGLAVGSPPRTLGAEADDDSNRGGGAGGSAGTGSQAANDGGGGGGGGAGLGIGGDGANFGAVAKPGGFGAGGGGGHGWSEGPTDISKGADGGSGFLSILIESGV